MTLGPINDRDFTTLLRKGDDVTRALAAQINSARAEHPDAAGVIVKSIGDLGPDHFDLVVMHARHATGLEHGAVRFRREGGRGPKVEVVVHDHLRPWNLHKTLRDDLAAAAAQSLAQLTFIDALGNRLGPARAPGEDAAAAAAQQGAPTPSTLSLQAHSQQLRTLLADATFQTQLSAIQAATTAQGARAAILDPRETTVSIGVNFSTVRLFWPTGPQTWRKGSSGHVDWHAAGYDAARLQALVAHAAQTNCAHVGWFR